MTKKPVTPDPTPDLAPHGSVPAPLDAPMLELLASGVRFMAWQSLDTDDDVADVVQETMARLAAALREGRLKDPAKIGAFARGIAHHVIADAVRQRIRSRPLDPASAAEEPDGAASPLDQLVHDEQLDILRRAIAQLTDDERKLLELVYAQGIVPVELARLLGEPRARVRKRKSRVLDKLRQIYFAFDRLAASQARLRGDYDGREDARNTSAARDARSDDNE